MIKSNPVRLSAVKNGHPKSQSDEMATLVSYRRTPMASGRGMHHHTKGWIANGPSVASRHRSLR
jgi:hypothetical protein